MGTLITLSVRALLGAVLHVAAAKGGHAQEVRPETREQRLLNGPIAETFMYDRCEGRVVGDNVRRALADRLRQCPISEQGQQRFMTTMQDLTARFIASQTTGLESTPLFQTMTMQTCAAMKTRTDYRQAIDRFSAYSQGKAALTELELPSCERLSAVLQE